MCLCHDNAQFYAAGSHHGRQAMRLENATRTILYIANNVKPVLEFPLRNSSTVEQNYLTELSQNRDYYGATQFS